MATFISTNSDGFLTYKNDPQEAEVLFKNIKDTYPESELTEINEKIAGLISTTAGEDVTDDITFTNGNYTTFTLIKAVKIANILFIQGTVTPTTEMGPIGSASAIFDFNSALGVDSRAGFGLTSDKFFGAYVTVKEDDTTKINIKKIDNTNWPTSVTVGVTMIIPLANESESAEDETETAEDETESAGD